MLATAHTSPCSAETIKRSPVTTNDLGQTLGTVVAGSGGSVPAGVTWSPETVEEEKQFPSPSWRCLAHTVVLPCQLLNE